MFLLKPFAFILLGMSATPGEESTHEWLGKALECLHQAQGMGEHEPQRRGLFGEAGRRFTELYEMGHRNPGCLFDEGNAYLQAGDLPRAILAYRRGLRIAPHDKRLRANIEYARSLVDQPNTGVASPASPGDRFLSLSRFAPHWTLVGTGTAYVLIWLGLMRWFMVRKNGWITFVFAASILFAAGGLSLIPLYLADREDRHHPPLVIATDGVLLRAGNGLAYPLRMDTPLNRGVEARLLYIRGEWIQIELANQETGWIPRDYALIDN